MGTKIQLLSTIKKQNIHYFDQSKTKKTKATFILPQMNTTKKILAATMQRGFRYYLFAV